VTERAARRRKSTPSHPRELVKPSHLAQIAASLTISRAKTRLLEASSFAAAPKLAQAQRVENPMMHAGKGMT
jgi:hypothetical protein